MKKLYLDLGNTRLKYWILDNDTIIAHDAREHLKAPNELLLGLLGTLSSFNPEFVGISSVLGDKINTAIMQTLDGLGVPYEFAKVNAHHALLTTTTTPHSSVWTDGYKCWGLPINQNGSVWWAVARL